MAVGNMSASLLLLCLFQCFLQVFSQEEVIPQLCENKNGGCEHFCTVIQGAVQCNCADGYFLASNEKSCHSNETFKCGAINTSEKENDTQHQFGNCPPGECPWQALLMDEDQIGFCGGTILNKNIILTAAHCMDQFNFSVRLGEFDRLVTDGNEVDHEVETTLTHTNYNMRTYENDIALIKLAAPINFTRFILPACIPEQDFAEKILMHEPVGVVSGFGSLGEGQKPATIMKRFILPYVDNQTCINSTKHLITDDMFCAGYGTEAKDPCQGDGGGPHVTRYRDTYFITGIVSWGEGCGRKGKYGIYTKVSKYIQWIHEGIKKLMLNDASSDRHRANL